MVSLSDVAAMGGMTRQRVAQIMADEEGTPPFTQTLARKIWYRADVELFLALRVGRAPRKLTEGQVGEIWRRAASESQTKLAAEFGVSQPQVSRIYTGRGWRKSAAQ